MTYGNGFCPDYNRPARALNIGEVIGSTPCFIITQTQPFCMHKLLFIIYHQEIKTIYLQGTKRYCKNKQEADNEKATQQGHESQYM